MRGRVKEERTFLVVYDIADPARLRNVAKAMQDYGSRVQKSVFEVRADLKSIRELGRRVRAILDPAADSVRYYTMCERDWQKRQAMGKGSSNRGNEGETCVIV
ncbi:MAG TPA: CRISPR-associated endonuclease Cas2 [Deltaproteobacteria bacterium]|nr:CRISPR-associated endonuclease Cas2 [Deltaproteobacteria bacterium]HQI80840.1 CRISPR-associated endonuclease Cas2 [Deltaproteobacteria bacterium]